MFKINQNLQKYWSIPQKGVQLVGRPVITQVPYYFLLLLPVAVWPFHCIQIRETEVKLVTWQVIRVYLMVEFEIWENKSSMRITKYASYRENFLNIYRLSDKRQFTRQFIINEPKLVFWWPLNYFIWLYFQRRYGY